MFVVVFFNAVQNINNLFRINQKKNKERKENQIYPHSKKIPHRISLRPWHRFERKTQLKDKN